MYAERNNSGALAVIFNSSLSTFISKTAWEIDEYKICASQ
jgi:hypothetical protein